MEGERLGGRLPLLAPEQLKPAARALYDRLTGGRLGAGSPFRNRTDAGALIGPFNALLHAPAIGDGFIDFHEAEERATPLSPRLREIVILSVGAVWGSAYELYAHRAVAMRAGFAPATVATLAAGDVCTELDNEERIVQRFTLELARDRQVRDETYAACEDALGRERTTAIVFLAAAYVGTCTVLNAFAVPAPDDR